MKKKMSHDKGWGECLLHIVELKIYKFGENLWYMYM